MQHETRATSYPLDMKLAIFAAWSRVEALEQSGNLFGATTAARTFARQLDSDLASIYFQLLSYFRSLPA